jgi:hypothetical protein
LRRGLGPRLGDQRRTALILDLAGAAFIWAKPHGCKRGWVKEPARRKPLIPLKALDRNLRGPIPYATGRAGVHAETMEANLGSMNRKRPKRLA